MEKWICALKIKDFFSTGPGEKIYLFPQADFLTQKEKVFHSFSFHIPLALWICLGPLAVGDVGKADRGSVPLFLRQPLSHGLRRASSPVRGAEITDKS